MDPRLLKIGRLILIPLAILLLVWVWSDGRALSGTALGQKVFERSLTERWPTATAVFNKPFTLWHANPYKKGGAFSILPDYTYKVGDVTCSGNRFEFGPRKTVHTDIAAGDLRLNDMIKGYCPGQPKKTTTKNTLRYEYQCYPMPVFYDPQNTCVSYIAKPRNADTVRLALAKSATHLKIMIAMKLLLVGVCIFLALPLLKSGVRRLKK